jgi:hypothetical protein
MAEPKKTKPKTPKAKPTPPGQGSMDFNRQGGALQRLNRDFTRTSAGDAKYTGQPRPQPKPKTGGALVTTQPSTPSRTGGSFGANGQQATGRFREIQTTQRPSGLGNRGRTQLQNIVEPPSPSRVGGSFGSNGVKATGPFGNRANGLAVRPQPQTPTVVPRPIDGGKVNTPRVVVNPRPIPGPPPPTPDFRVSPRPVPPRTPDMMVRPKPGALQVVDKVDDAGRIIGGVVKGKPKGRFGLLAAAAAGATALGAGYLMSRRNENEDKAAPQQAGANISIPGRNAPPSSGNEADRSLYPAAGGEPAAGGGTAPKQPTLTDRVRGNNKANRNPTEYLGEAFDATVKRGRDIGRKHLQGMLVRDSVDESTAKDLMSRYDKEIGSQRTLKDYKSEGIAQKFDRENPGKAGRILDEYRGMGRREGAAPAGATYAQIKERALR